MAGEKIQIEGLRETTARLRKLDKALVKEIRVINKAAAESVALEAKARAPRRSGKLAGSIRAGATQRSGIVRMGGAAVPYAGPIHFGWYRHHIQPQPFLYNALDERRPAVYEAYKTSIDALIIEHFPGGL